MREPLSIRVTTYTLLALFVFSAVVSIQKSGTATMKTNSASSA